MKRINRRVFLGVSGAGAIALAIGGVGLGLRATVLRQPRVPLKSLDLRSFSVLAAVADTFCPGTAELPTAWELQVPEGVDAFLASAHPGVAAELIQGLMLVENALPGLIFDGRVRPFSACSPAQQSASLAGMATSRVALRRTLYKALLGLVSATYWGHPDAYIHAGYAPPDFSGFLPAEQP